MTTRKWEVSTKHFTVADGGSTHAQGEAQSSREKKCWSPDRTTGTVSREPPWQVPTASAREGSPMWLLTDGEM